MEVEEDEATVRTEKKNEGGAAPPEEDVGETRRKTPTRTSKKTKTRRRGAVVVIREGRLVSEEGPAKQGKGTKRTQFLPRVEEIITQEMADPRRGNNGYRTQETLIASARTSGVYWRNTGVRDHRAFPGNTKKTLRDRASNPSSSREEAPTGEESLDPPWGTEDSNPEIDPG